MLAVAANLGVVVVWVFSRTTGLPIGPDAGQPEAVGVADVTATAFEIALVAGALVSLGARHARSPLTPRGVWLLALPAVAAAAIALAPGGSHGHGDHDAHPAEHAGH